MTFSIVARCAETGMFGVAIASSSPAVAARCAFARAGVGAVASQNVTDPRLGPQVLDQMGRGLSAHEILTTLGKEAPFAEYRQILAVDQQGCSAAHSGPKALGIWAQALAPDLAAGGNLLAHDAVPQAMIDGFLVAAGSLGDRMIAAMKAGLAAGGEAGPIHSAGLLLVDHVSWPVADLRCDWTDACPIDALASLWERYKPQLDAYVQRALDPVSAPSYGVPGDE